MRQSCIDKKGSEVKINHDLDLPQTAALPLPNLEFQLFLKEEYQRRFDRTPNYSLRKFAQAINLNSGTLSQILRGQRTIGARTFKRICEALDLPEEMRAKFSLKNELNDDYQTNTDKNMTCLNLDTLEIISKWYHFAILELVQTDNFHPCYKFIAQRLDISPLTAEVASKRLFRIGYLETDDSGNWMVSQKNLSTTKHKYTNQALKGLQADFLKKSLLALEYVSINKRDHSGLTIAIRKADLPLYKEKISSFRRDLNSLAQATNESDEVYHLSISLFPISKCAPSIESEDQNATI